MRINLVIQVEHFPDLHARLESMSPYDRASYIRTLLRDGPGLSLKPVNRQSDISAEENNTPSHNLMDSALVS